MRWMISMLLRFPFNAPGAPGNAVESRVEGEANSYGMPAGRSDWPGGKRFRQNFLLLSCQMAKLP
jgi:hypothetical protein